ncbi:hypothetical protein D9615_002256 [Tricholomella constricta]|uniref:F-box domain-containing protein n=1 Tax=Tricholomella constricta TaxID=117010 RepID=A0A8H5M9S0_9AGAR|nr:hypothetical protein D9615_002256 [Tricholomella constricta]
MEEDKLRICQAPIPYHYLPPEILSLIFLRAIPPSFLLDSSLSAGPGSPWFNAMATRKSILLVCQEWYTASIELLYQEVVFRRIAQIPAFLQTLEASPGKFEPFIKELTLHAFIPASHGSSFVKYIQRVIDLCPRIAKFTFASRCHLPTTARLPVLRASITHLQLHASVPLVDVLNILDIVGESLLRLLIHVPASFNQYCTTKVYYLAHLEDLLIETTPVGNENLFPMGRILSMPSLQRLTFKIDFFAQPGFETLSMENFTSFCRMHGHHLQFLHLHPNFSWTMRRYTIMLQGLLDVCPMLEHLVLHPCAGPVTHPNVKWVDIWSPHPAAAKSWIPLRQSLTKAAFPKLQRVRQMSSGLALFYDVPTLMPPNAIDTKDDAFELCFAGIEARCDMDFLRCQRPIDVDPVYGDGEEEDYSDDSSSSNGIRNGSTITISEHSMDDLYQDSVSVPTLDSEYLSSDSEHSSDDSEYSSNYSSSNDVFHDGSFAGSEYSLGDLHRGSVSSPT